jgi:hypothetical protein
MGTRPWSRAMTAATRVRRVSSICLARAFPSKTSGADMAIPLAVTFTTAKRAGSEKRKGFPISRDLVA